MENISPEEPQQGVACPGHCDSASCISEFCMPHTELIVEHIKKLCVPLYTAILDGNIEMVDLLLHEPNVDLNYKVCENITPLLLSLMLKNRRYSWKPSDYCRYMRPEHGDMDTLDYLITRLIEAGSDVNVLCIHKLSPLHLAIGESCISISHMLIQKGADIDALDEVQRTPLHCAIQFRNLEAVFMLIYYEANANFWNFDKDFRTPIPLTHRYLDRCDPKDVDIPLTLLDYTGDLDSALFVSMNNHDFYYEPDSDSGEWVKCNTSRCNTAVCIAIERVKAGADVNRYLYGTDFLTISLKIGSVDLFKSIAERFDSKILLNTLFMRNCINNNFDLPRKDWLECLYRVLEFPVASELMHLNNCHLAEVVDALMQRKVERRDVIAILSTFLLLNISVGQDAISKIYDYYGFNEVLEAVIYCFPNQQWLKYIRRVHVVDSLMVHFILVDQDITDEVFFSYFERIERRRMCSSIRKLDKLAKFFSLPFYLKSSSLNLPHVHRLVEKLEVNATEVPSLLELSRNAMRKFIKESNNIEVPYHFYDAVKRLNMPPAIENIVCLKTPIY